MEFSMSFLPNLYDKKKDMVKKKWYGIWTNFAKRFGKKKNDMVKKNLPNHEFLKFLKNGWKKVRKKQCCITLTSTTWLKLETLKGVLQHLTT